MKNKNKLIIIISIVLIVSIFAIWFFNRTFTVTIDYGNEKKYLKVKYNSKLDEKDILDKEKLGDKFINYHIVNKDGVSNLIFNLDTKITKNIEIKAMYENDIETIKVDFDSNGGTKIESLTIEKGSKLVLPKSPTKEGYIFKNWKDKEGNIIKNGTVLENDITLYAVYEKESKPTENKPTESKPTENKPSENKPSENKPSENKPTEPVVKEVSVEGVKLNTNKKEIVANTVDKLVATISPSNATDKSLTWSSDNEKVVTVDKNGNIKGVGFGEANITVKTSNGKTATAKVYSNPKSITLASATTKYISLYGTQKKATYTIKIDGNGLVVPNDAIEWDAPDAFGSTAPVSINTSGNVIDFFAREVFSMRQVSATIKVGSLSRKFIINVEPKISIYNTGSGINCSEYDGRLRCSYKGEKVLKLHSNVPVDWTIGSSNAIERIDKKESQELVMYVKYAAQTGINIKAKTNAGQTKEIVLTPQL